MAGAAPRAVTGGRRHPRMDRELHGGRAARLRTLSGRAPVARDESAGLAPGAMIRAWSSTAAASARALRARWRRRRRRPPRIRDGPVQQRRERDQRHGELHLGPAARGAGRGVLRRARARCDPEAGVLDAAGSTRRPATTRASRRSPASASSATTSSARTAALASSRYDVGVGRGRVGPSGWRCRSRPSVDPAPEAHLAGLAPWRDRRACRAGAHRPPRLCGTRW